MSIVLSHWGCQKCGCEKFRVVLEDKKFNLAKIKKIICMKCGLIYENVKEVKKKQRKNL